MNQMCLWQYSWSSSRGCGNSWKYQVAAHFTRSFITFATDVELPSNLVNSLHHVTEYNLYTSNKRFVRFLGQQLCIQNTPPELFRKLLSSGEMSELLVLVMWLLILHWTKYNSQQLHLCFDAMIVKQMQYVQLCSLFCKQNSGLTATGK
jgi:hypothetical protein